MRCPPGVTTVTVAPDLDVAVVDARLVLIAHLAVSPSSTDPELRKHLLELYEEQEESVVWERRLAPFIAAHKADLLALYGRNRQLPNPLLDELEALLVLERLDSVPTLLAESWPRSPIELERLA